MNTMEHAAPTTIEEAMELREVYGGLLYEQDVNGNDVQTFMGAGKLQGDSIAFFCDTDGIIKTVSSIRRSIDGPDEWVKVSV